MGVSQQLSAATPRERGPLGREVARAVIVSVNLGGVATRAWRGVQVASAIAKHPVERSIAVRGVNLEGDDQADRVAHGGPRKSVYAYPSEHYAWWSEEFGVERARWGLVGENLTLRGLVEEDVAFGDVLVAGTTRLLITEPRGPCYKLAMQIGSDFAPTQMLRSGRTGFYLGVLEEGELSAADEVTVYDGGVSPRVTMAELCSAYAAPAKIGEERLEELAALPGLDHEWRDHFEHELERRRRPAAGSAPKRRALKVSSTSRVAHDVLMIEFEAADGQPLSPYEAGQFLPLVVNVDGREQVRCYSLLDGPSAGRCRVAVRRSREETGQPSVSRWLHATAREGLAFDARDPAGAFTLADTREDEDTVLIAGGIGITPMLALARVLAETERSFALYFGVRAAAELLFEEELRELARHRRCAGVHLFYPDARDHADGLQRIDSAIIETASITSRFGSDSDFFVCGPGPMQEALVERLQEAGVDERSIRVEYFAAGAAQAVDAPAQEVVFDRHCRVVLWSDPASSLLDLATEHGIEIPYSCRSGSCGTCAVRLLSGAVGYRRAPAAPVEDGWCLSCVAYPLEATVIDA